MSVSDENNSHNLTCFKESFGLLLFDNNARALVVFCTGFIVKNGVKLTAEGEVFEAEIVPSLGNIRVHLEAVGSRCDTDET